MNTDKIVQSIQNGQTGSAIQLLKELDLGRKERNILTIIEAEFSELSSEIIKGTIDDAQKQLKLNRINDKLLNLLYAKSQPGKKKKRTLLIASIVFVFIAASLSFYYINTMPGIEADCPVFNQSSKNMILLVPFQNIGSSVSKPHVLFQDRIEQLIIENNLSTDIKVGEVSGSISLARAPEIAEYCEANVIVWGKYSSSSDSLRLILQYHFLDQPDWSSMGDLITLKDVTTIQSGEISKDLEDSILLLCSIMALRKNDLSLAKEWLAKIQDESEDRNGNSIETKLREVISEL